MLPILYEDDSVIVLNKPAGMPSTRHAQHTSAKPLPAAQRSRPLVMEDSVADALADYLPTLAQVGTPGIDCGLAHRLDNDTSGCLLAAKTSTSHAQLRRQFDQGLVEKEYVALIWGHPPQSATITQAIQHHPKSKQRMQIAPVGSGQDAVTTYTVIQYYPISAVVPSGFAAVKVRIKTGVRHQIRVHLASIGHPLLGDRQYQSTQQQQLLRLPCPYHMLHASQLSFTSPSTSQRIYCRAPLPTHFSHFLAQAGSGSTIDEN